MGVAAAVAAVAASAALQYKTGQEANSLQKDAMKAAEKRSRDAATAADQAYNKANQKTPYIAGLTGANESAGKAGISSTMLTGPGGIDPSALLLGRTTLLGG